MPSKDELPSFLTALKVGETVPGVPRDCYDVKFYPYTPRDVEPIFAAVSLRKVVICRLNHEETRPIEIILELRDDGVDEQKPFYCLDWAQAGNGDPLLLISGSDPQIKILNARTGQLVNTFVGHGASVHSLAVSPIDTSVLASASDDCAIRLWTLEPEHMRQPTAAILYGQGHKEGVLTVAFHRKGKYLLSGGMDSRVNLWMVPKNLKANLGTDKPHFVHYPHFSSTDIHQNFVDCVQFHNDMIFSRAAKENRIIAWRIDNFNGEEDPPNPPPIPQLNVVESRTPVTIPARQLFDTRSAWAGRYQTLMQFDVPHSELFYTGFRIFHEPDQHPILAAGNTKNKIFFWDLERLEDVDVQAEMDRVYGSDTKAEALITHANRVRSTSEMTSESASTRSTDTTMDTGQTLSTPTITAPNHRHDPQPPRKPWKSKPAKNTLSKSKGFVGGIANPFQPIPAHKTCTIPKEIREETQGNSRCIEDHVPRQIAFSRGGDWCVVAGNRGILSVFERWREGFPGEGEAEEGGERMVE
ncbi:WD40 repeat-like protein [Amniculicola lignicola CBS 123094]|uniref:WD40 repeat-like protein n=1 Tax=Amniculicola lignicola CBS 123094 TaxID=1392246 RepID=A0A6A5WN99_9PLEO|nr:WD40 repeat-like protein [Amniculicola lignicola CBS 123094]